MAEQMRIGLDKLLRKARVEGDAGFLREGVRVLSEALMEIEVEQHVGAARHERTPERSGYRNGYRRREWDTRVATVELEVPRVRDGVATSLRSWSRGGAPRGPWRRWYRKLTSTGSPPARSTSSSRRWA